MKVYLVRASEWETEVDCICATRELAERERKRLAKEYDLDDEAMEEFIKCWSMKVIEE